MVQNLLVHLSFGEDTGPLNGHYQESGRSDSHESLTTENDKNRLLAGTNEALGAVIAHTAFSILNRESIDARVSNIFV